MSARADWRPPSRDRVARIRARLAAEYGVPVLAPHGRPVDELVLTVLSQSTSDRNRDVAFLRLRERWGDDWAAVRDAEPAQVEEAIRPGGLHRQKAPRIQAMLAAIDLGDERVLADRSGLCALPGVGRKTAACVRLFSFGLRDVPVDTHVGRVSQRLALLRPRAGSDEQHDAFLSLTPRGAELELHVNLLRHGRRVCVARDPRCAACLLRSMCPVGRARSGSAPARGG